MGKVIKASLESTERYTVAIPVLAVAQPPAASEVLPDDDGGFAAFAAESVESNVSEVVQPAIDMDAVHAQTQKLLDDAKRSSETLVDDARERARVVVDDATRDAESIAEDSRRTANAQGYAAGTQTANAEMETMLGALRDLLEAIRGERHAFITSAEPELVRLALGIAERVLHQQVALDHGVVVEMARAALSRIVDREKITVRVNPADVERMREHRDELLKLGDVKTMRVIEDQRVDRGGVIIETDAGSIDAKITTQLDEARKILHIVDDVVVGPSPLHDLGQPLPTARAS